MLLSADSSDYCQALTIIVDEKSGALPLMQNKEDFAFDDNEYEKVWERNILICISAVTKV